MALVSSTVPEPPRKKKTGPKGPNPLSVKKKKASATPAKKDEGKGRETDGPSIVWEKRKRDSPAHMHDNGGETSQPRKRRRRKGITSNTHVVDNES
jgi:U3 small nucleolar RNA-associated protein 23